MGRGKRRVEGARASVPLRVIRRRVLSELIRQRSPISFADGQRQPLDDEPIARYALIAHEDSGSHRTLSIHSLPELALEWMEQYEQDYARIFSEFDPEDDVDIHDGDEPDPLVWEIVDLDGGYLLEADDLRRARDGHRHRRDRPSALAIPA